MWSTLQRNDIFYHRSMYTSSLVWSFLGENPCKQQCYDIIDTLFCCSGLENSKYFTQNPFQNI